MMSSQCGAKTVIEWRTAVGSAERGRQGTILESVMEGGSRQREQKTQENSGMSQDISRGMEVSNQSQRPRSHHRGIARRCQKGVICPTSTHQREGLES